MKKKIIPALFLLMIAGAIGWFFLLRPEQNTESFLQQNFADHKQAYEDIA